MKKLVLGLIALLVSCAFALAVPAYPGLITTTQPDGSTISFYLRGDENFSFKMTEDGYLIALNADGVFEYAELDANNSIVPLGVKASDISKRDWKENRFLKKLDKVSDFQSRLNNIVSDKIQQKRQRDMNRALAKYPTEGSPKSLVILVNFQDLKFVSETPLADFNDMLNQDGYSKNQATSSAREYFRASSFGQFDPEFVVVGPYDLPNDVSYYGANKGSNNDPNATQMIIHACELADAAGLDFTEFDTDSNNILDNVFVYYAGHNEAEYGGENTVWPHRGSVRNGTTIDGIKLQGYACTSELKGAKGTTQCGIGTFCHEFGHVLELPDLYVTDYSHDAPTLEAWDIMNGGAYNNGGKTPPTYSSYERFFCNWLVPEPIDSVLGLHHLEPLITSNKAYIFSKTPHNLDGYSPNPKEFFMLENRQRTGIDSLAMPGEGLLVTHIDFDRMYWMTGLNNPNVDPNHMRVQLVCAASNAKEDPERNPFPGADGISTLYFTFHDKQVWETPVVSIREHGNDITFIYGETEETPNISFSEKLSDFDTFYGTDQEKDLEIVFKNIKGKINISFDDSRNFLLRGVYENDSIGELTPQIAFEIPTTDEYRFNVKAVFRPRKISYDEYFADRLIVESEEFITEMPVRGISRRPINIVTPIAYPATDITKTSFVANWSYDEYATGYYLSVYTKSDVESDEVEKFGLFGNGNPEGWKYNFTTTNKTYTGSAPLSLQFTSSADTLWTKKYFLPVKSFSFWVRSLYEAQGTIYVDGLIDSVWTNLLTQPFESSTINKIISADVTAGECREFKIYVTIDNPTARTALLFDDFKTIFATTIKYVLKDEEVLDNKKYVSNYDHKTKFYYSVRATDKELSDKDGKYENVSAYSNEICVGDDGEQPGKDKVAPLNISFKDGHFVVNLMDLKSNYVIYIYSADGTLVDEIEPTEKDVVLPRLDPNMYIVKYSQKGKVSRNDQSGKIFY
ncbi:MAG: M6 family metalloprotease domain-containing protein [Paludibacteraceae bacterium]|nr:M6 family metalloprotease domain-containing protein [Paludibacteraceae bacterium]